LYRLEVGRGGLVLARDKMVDERPAHGRSLRSRTVHRCSSSGLTEITGNQPWLAWPGSGRAMGRVRICRWVSNGSGTSCSGPAGFGCRRWEARPSNPFLPQLHASLVRRVTHIEEREGHVADRFGRSRRSQDDSVAPVRHEMRSRPSRRGGGGWEAAPRPHGKEGRCCAARFSRFVGWFLPTVHHHSYASVRSSPDDGGGCGGPCRGCGRCRARVRAPRRWWVLPAYQPAGTSVTPRWSGAVVNPCRAASASSRSIAADRRQVSPANRPSRFMTRWAGQRQVHVVRRHRDSQP